MTEPPGPGHRVVIGNANPGQWSTHFSESYAALRAYDREHGHFHAMIHGKGGASGVHRPRNEVVARYLAAHADDAHWLLFVDSDMVFPPTILRRMLGVAHDVGTRILGALTVMDLGELHWVPNLFQFAAGRGAYTQVQFDYPDDAVVQVAATGAACLLIHRDVLRAMRERDGHDYTWFFPRLVQTAGGWHELGEDVSFCTKAIEQFGERVFVDTGLHVGHVRNGRVYGPPDARALDPDAPVAVVIPMKDRADLTATLLSQIARGGGVSRVFICDNGSVEQISRDWLTSLEAAPTPVVPVTVLDMPDVGIHHMWNAAAVRATDEFGARCRVVFLNNDVDLRPGALRVLSRAMADHPTFAVMGLNYDGRVVTDSPDGDVQEVWDICASRYDGTGGVGGFAFAVRGEWFTGGGRFPEDLTWWYGDNDLVLSVLAADRNSLAGRGFGRYRVGIALNAHCEHAGAGTAGDWSDPAWTDVLAADRERFEAKWAARTREDRVSEAIMAGDWWAATDTLALVPSDIQDHLLTLRDLAVEVGARRIVELGVRAGLSTVALLAAADKTDGHVWAVDIDPAPGHVRAAARSTTVRGRSTGPEALAAVGDEPVDLVLVDTNHDVDLTRAELATWAPRVAPHGLIVLHDTAVESFPHHAQQGLAEQPPFPVRVAVDEFVAANPSWRVADHTDACNGLTVLGRAW